jgi:uncharacterized protein
MDLTRLYSQTFTGKKFYYFNASPEMVDIEDIAHALSQQCRFNGHCEKFYSVAEHCYHASFLVPEGLELEALLHDASEAYIGDIPKPFKTGIESTISPLEDSILDMIFEKYGLNPLPFPSAIKEVDLEMLYWERTELMGSPENEWECFSGVTFDPKRKPIIRCWQPKTAKQKFLQRFQELQTL